MSVKKLFESLVGKIDNALGILHGVSVITEGPARGHGQFIDATTLKQVKECAEKYSGGLKVKMNHYSGAESIIGKLENFRIEGDKLRADLHLVKSHEKFSYILEICQMMPDSIGLSISFSGSVENIKNIEYTRCTEIYSADLVDTPAANPDGLFHQEVDNKNKGNAGNSQQETNQSKNMDEKIFNDFKGEVNSKFEALKGLIESLKPAAPAPITKEQVEEFAAKKVAEALAKVGQSQTPPPNPEDKKKEDEKPKTFSQIVDEKVEKGMKRTEAIEFCVKNHAKEYKEHREDLGFVTKNAKKEILN